VALGIEERQLKMEEIKKNMSAKQAELVEKTIRRRQMLLDLTLREVEESKS
jgi:hypothetical protein